MPTWDHRAGTGNAAYQLYLYVDEYATNNGGVGTSYINWELGLIKVGSSGGFASSQGSCPWEVHMQGNNNGDTSGTGSFSFGANDAIGTRRAIASLNGWSFAHNGDYSGQLSLNTMARIVSGISIGSPQIGWGWVGMTNITRGAAAPAAPALLSRTDTSLTIRSYNSNDWGVGTGALTHHLDYATHSNLDNLVWITYPTTGGGAAHDNTITVDPYTTYYARDTIQDRTGAWVPSGVVAFYARPSPPPAPDVTSKTPTTINLSAAPSSYAGAGFTARETELWNAAQTVKIATSTDLGNPSFTALTRVTQYKIRTRLQNSTGWSDWSAWQTVSTPGTAPSAPTGYTVQNIASTSAMVTLGSLSDNGGAVPSQVRVKVSTTNSDTGLIQTNTYDSWNAALITGLTKGTNYWVAEAAYNTVEGGGWGAYGAYVPFVTLANVPNAPTLSMLSAGSTNATLQWVAPTQLNGATIASYKLRVGTDKALTQNLQDFTVAPGTLSQVVTGLTAASTYYAAIWTETDNGTGSVSPVLTFATTGGGGTSSGLWYSGADGVPKFSEVWYSGADGVPKLCEVWYSGADGIPKLCTS